MLHLYRLRERERFQQIRREGKTRDDRLVVLVCLHNELLYSRFGFSASRRVGKAVVRNRARRLMRESARLQISQIHPGWDIVFIARSALARATFWQVDASCRKLLGQAGLLYDTPIPSLPAAALSPDAGESSC